MSLKKTFAVLSAFMLVFSIAGIAMAENTVEVEVNSEPIPQGTACSKAGGLSFSFDEGTVLRVGDVITIDTDYNTTLCRSFDFIVSPAADVVIDAQGYFVSGTKWVNANIPLVDGPFTQSVAATITSPIIGATGNTAATTGGVIFRIVGVANTQRITIYVLGDRVLNYGADGVAGGGDDYYMTNGDAINVTDSDGAQPEFAVLKILDEKTFGAANPVGPTQWTNPGLWEVSNTAANGTKTYGAAADWDDNTLCINVSNPAFTASVVNGNIDSKDDKFSFLPSNPQIAHIANPINISSPCKVTPDNIAIPGEQSTCAFDYESGVGYCSYNATATPAYTKQRQIVLSSTSPFTANESYSVTLQILSPANVYWSTTTIGYDNMSTATCVKTAATKSFAGGTAYDSAGNVLTSFIGDTGSCTVAAENRAKKITSASAQIFNNGDKALYIDMPTFVIDGLDGVAAGDTVQVMATLTKFPCGDVWTDTIDVGTFGCTGGVDAASTTLYYPYMTAASDSWWDGLVITNMSANAGSADITIYEADGDQGTLNDVAIVANGQYVRLLGDIIDTFTMTVSTGSGTLGDSNGYLKIVCDFAADGFAMMGNFTEAQGYLPRKY